VVRGMVGDRIHALSRSVAAVRTSMPTSHRRIPPAAPLLPDGQPPGVVASHARLEAPVLRLVTRVGHVSSSTLQARAMAWPAPLRGPAAEAFAGHEGTRIALARLPPAPRSLRARRTGRADITIRSRTDRKRPIFAAGEKTCWTFLRSNWDDPAPRPGGARGLPPRRSPRHRLGAGKQRPPSSLGRSRSALVCPRAGGLEQLLPNTPSSGLAPVLDRSRLVEHNAP